MVNTSTAYREAMKAPLRDRAYMRVTLGATNHKAQTSSSIGEADPQATFSKSTIIATSAKTASYAGLDCCSASGKQILLPTEGGTQDTGLVSLSPVGTGSYSMRLNFKETLDLKGLSLTFDEYSHPGTIKIETANAIKTYTNTTGTDWVTEDAFNEIDYIILRFSNMVPSTSRLRLKHITFGYGLQYTNEDILDSSWRVYTSQLSEDMPQVDVSVTLKNYDQYFDPDNPSSVINYFDTDMPIQVEYGMTLPSGDVEWMQAASCYISDWQADNKKAIIRGNDSLRTKNEVYRKGQYYPNGITLYQLAQDVFADAGIETYYIDPYLQNITTKNPLPQVSHKECIQIIANASRCMFSINRKGYPQLVSAYNAELTVSATQAADWANVGAIMTDSAKKRYAIFYTDFVSVKKNSNSVLYPGTNLTSGYVTSCMSGADKTFATPPVITLQQTATTQRTGLTIRFGEAVPAKIRITTYDAEDDRVEYFTVTDLRREYTMPYTFQAFTKMEIAFLETAKAYQPVDVEYVSLQYVTDFSIDRIDMLSHPVVTNERMVKQVDVVATYYEPSTEETSLYTEEVLVPSANYEMDIDLPNPHYDYTASTEEGYGVQVVASGAYYARVKFAKAGRQKVTLSGKEYKSATSTHTTAVHYRGEVKSWSNPLICSKEMAETVGAWLADYYSNSISYSYETRGNPELDATDIIYQHNQYRDQMQVRVQEAQVTFNGAYRGKLVTRRVPTDE